MHGLFNYDSPLIQTLNKAADCICLSFLWLIACIPLVTAGAATTALYYATNKCIRRSEGGVWKSFWHSFRSNFKQSTKLWLVLLLLYALLAACCCSAYLMCSSGYLPKEMFYFLLLVAAVVILWASFLFPYLARFQNSIRSILRNCVFIALMNIPVGLLHLALLALCLVAVVIFPLMVLCMPGVYMVLSCYALEPVFRKYMTEADRAQEDARDEGSLPL